MKFYSKMNNMTMFNLTTNYKVSTEVRSILVPISIPLQIILEQLRVKAIL